MTIQPNATSAIFGIYAMDAHAANPGGARSPVITATAPNYTFNTVTDASGTKSERGYPYGVGFRGFTNHVDQRRDQLQ